MKFQSVNELNQFSFRDCELRRIERSEASIRLELEGLIVLPANSQNSNFTASYAGPAIVRLPGGKLLSAVKEGYRYLDADGRLLKELPDVPLCGREIEELLARCSDCRLLSFLEQTEQDRGAGTKSSLCELTIEFPPENPYDTLPTESYRLTMSSEKIIFEWDFYMNRVQE